MEPDVKPELLKMTPPVGVATATIAGYPLSEWVLGATLVYTIVQTGWLLFKIFRYFQGGDKK